MKKNLLLLLFAICSLASWADGFNAVVPSGHTLYFEITDEQNKTVSVAHPGSETSMSGDLVIPDSISDGTTTYAVTSIGRSAFSSCSDLTSVTIGNAVTSLQYYAFNHCSGLKRISIGSSVTAIEESAFNRCNNVDTMFYNAKNLSTTSSWNYVALYTEHFGFRSMRFRHLTIGDSVQTLPQYVFSGQDRLVNVTIPNSVTSIGKSAFAGCSSLTKINIPYSVTSIGDQAFENCTNVDTLYFRAKNLTTSPEWYDASTSYNSYGFRPMTLDTLVIGDSVQTIPAGAFFGQSTLSAVTIPNSVSSIGESAFADCIGIPQIAIPSTVTAIGNNAFFRIKNIAYSGNAIGSPWGALAVNGFVEGDLIYENSNKTKLTGCNTAATNVVIPNSVTSIGNYAFDGCSALSNLTIGQSVAVIGTNAFFGCVNVDTLFYNAKSLSSAVIWYNPSTDYDSCGFRSMRFRHLVIGDSVQTLPEGAFFNQDSLVSVLLGKSVVTINDYAFSGCSKVNTLYYNARNLQTPYEWYSNANLGFRPMHLTTLVIGDSVQTLPKYVFYNQQHLTNVTIPDYVTTLEVHAFDGCRSLTSVNIPPLVTSIQNSTFDNCSSLTSITIPNSVDTIGRSAFAHCSSLTSVTIGEAVSFINDYAFGGCSNVDTLIFNAKELRTTDEWYNAVDYSSNFGFRPMQLKHLVIGDSVKTLPNYVFYGQNNLSTITIGTSLTSIGDRAFEGNSYVDTLYYNAKNLGNTSSWHDPMTNVTDLDYKGFRSLRCHTIVIGDSVQTLPDYVFYKQQYLTNLTIGSSVTSIGKRAFSACTELTNLTIPNSVKSIGEYAFHHCSKLKTVTIGESVTTIGNQAFYECNNVKTLHYNAKNLSATSDWYNSSESNNSFGFRPMALDTLTIGDSVLSLPEGVFYGQSHLTSLTIPESVTSIGNHAFEGCVNIDTLHYNAKNLSATFDWYNSSESNNSYGFRSMTLDTLVIGDSVKTLPYGVFYKQSSLSSVTIPESVTSIGSYAFSYCSGLPTLTIPNSVTSVGSYAFGNCSGLSSITLPNSLTSIESGSFLRCSNLTSISIPNSVTEIRPYAFRECSSLTSVSIGSSVRKIETQAFSGCTNVVTLYYNAKQLNTYEWSETDANYGFRSMPLRSVVIGDSVRTLPQNIFYSQANLTNIVIPNSVTSIGYGAFKNCSNLTSLTIPNSVTSIEGSAFWGCGNLAHVSIPNSITTINGYTFNDCSSLQSIVIPSSVTSIQGYAFIGCSNLKTVYNLSNLTFTKGTDTYGHVAEYALRVLSKDNGFTDHGTGSNTLHQISTSYTVVDEETGGETTIPRSTIPTNFIYSDGSNAKSASDWKANAIDLSDDTCRFFAPVAFTADTASYSRSFTNGNRSTLYLPFSAPIPDDFEVYAFSNYDNSTFTLNFSPVADSIQAHTPYLVGYGLSKAEHTTCTITATDIRFPATSDAATPEPSNGMTFQGTTARTCMSGTNYGYSNGFFVRSGSGSDHSAHAHVNPFRAYFSFTGAPTQMPPVTLGVGFDSSPLGIETPDNPNNNSSSIRYSNDVYDLMGRLVRRDAHSLLGLPNGIYIWRGQKLLHHN